MNGAGRFGSVLVKLLLVGGLVLLLWVPTGWVWLLVEERSDRRDEVRAEIGAAWGGEQQVVGPVLAVPATVVRSVRRDGVEESRNETIELVVLPETLRVTGAVEPELRARSIYQVVVYRSRLVLEGRFDRTVAEGLGVDPAAIRWERARLVVGLSDLRGLREVPRVDWGQRQVALREPGEARGVPTVSAPAPWPGDATTAAFRVALTLDGSDALTLAPVGRETAVELRSPWPDPSFVGAFLPDERTVGEDGFEARWSILDLNRSYPQAWRSDRVEAATLGAAVDGSAFGVRVLFPVDAYQRTARSVKYSLLFTALTLLAVFVIDHGFRQAVHLAQYLLVGCALVLFYLLLLSLGEVIGFAPAYLAAAAVVVGMVTAYARAVLDRPAAVAATAGVLTALYGCLFVMLHLEDLALLTGTGLLVVALGVLMRLTRSLHRPAAPARTDDPVAAAG